MSRVWNGASREGLNFEPNEYLKMATIDRGEILSALKRLGELAAARGESIDLLLLGGGVMVLVFEARVSTRDLDVAILAPADAQKVREIVKEVAAEKGWPEDWLNDAAKGYLHGISFGPDVFVSTGVRVRRPSTVQLLAMKLSAWRDEVDIADARRLLKELTGERATIWETVVPYLVPGHELKAKYAFDDLWEELHADT